MTGRAQLLYAPGSGLGGTAPRFLKQLGSARTALTRRSLAARDHSMAAKTMEPAGSLAQSDPINVAWHMNVAWHKPRRVGASTGPVDCAANGTGADARSAIVGDANSLTWPHWTDPDAGI